MSLMAEMGPLIGNFKSFHNFSAIRNIHFTTTQKVILWSLGVVGTSVAMVGVLSKYLARRRAKPVPNPRLRKAINKRISRMRSPNGGVPSVASSGGRSGSPAAISERLSLASGSLGSVVEDNTQLTPQQLGVMGMEALETSINYWEDALAAFAVATGGAPALTAPDEALFCKDLQDLLQNAYMLQDRSEVLFLDQRSVLFRSESGDAGGAGDARASLARSRTASARTARDHSSAESFASAEDQIADLREFDEFADNFPEIEKLELYQTALKQMEIGIPYRTLRTEVASCGSDAEYLCKLHCVRLAFQLLLKDAAVYAWLIDAGRQVLTDLLLYADREPKEFLVAYEEMLSWAGDSRNWSALELELASKGVKALTFYDVVLDYVLLDAFEDLNSPPASVMAVVNNRWLSNGFKESALTTAVWSIIKAKRRYLKYANGFMAHFYSISEHLLPVLVWGFLGPDESLRAVCLDFKEEIVACVADMFSFERSSYVAVDELAADIIAHVKRRLANITQRMMAQN